MDPKIVEQISVKIAENLNGITDGIRSISETALNQYTSAQYVYGFMLAGLALLLISGLIVCVILGYRCSNNNEEGATVACVISSVFLAIFTVISVINCFISFYNSMSPITVLVLGK